MGQFQKGLCLGDSHLGLDVIVQLVQKTRQFVPQYVHNLTPRLGNACKYSIGQGMMYTVIKQIIAGIQQFKSG